MDCCIKGEEMILDNTDPEGGWVDTHHFHKPEDTEEKIAEMTLDEKGVEAQVREVALA